MFFPRFFPHPVLPKRTEVAFDIRDGGFKLGSGNMNCFPDVFQGSREFHFQGTGCLQFAQGVMEPIKGMVERLFLVEEAICPSPVVMVLNQVNEQRYEEK